MQDERKGAQPTPPENKMGYMPVGKLLFSMALPMAFSMLVQALYNIVDSIFVARIGESALTAVSLAFPLQNFMIAIASGTAVGMNALLSRSLGQKNFDQANKAAGGGLFLSIISAVAFTLFGLFGARAYFAIQTADAAIVQAGEEYLSVVCIGGIAVFAQIMMERLLQSTGRTLYSMYLQLAGAITNIILDPIMIFGLLGCPAMGVKGAAIATVTGQLVAVSLGMYFNLKKNRDITLSFKGLIPHWPTIKTIYAVGLPSILMMSIGSVMTYGMNQILLGFTATAATVFGVYFKLQSFIFMPIFGLNNALVPIVAYNYGARNKARIKRAVICAMGAAAAVMALGCLVFQVMPQTMLGFFNPSEELLRLGVPALRIISTSFIVASFCIVAGSMFQALGNGVYSLVVSIARQLVVLLPTAYLFSLTGDVNKVWLSFPIAEVMSLAVTLIFLRRIYQQKIVPLGDAPV